MNDIFELFPERIVPGTPAAMQLPALTWGNYSKRRIQPIGDSRAKKESGLWKPLLSVANQIYLNVFGQISAFHNRSVLLGNDRHLFQPAHVAAYNRRNKVRHKKIDKNLQQIKDLQDRLAEKGTILLYLLSPNLLSLYPELLPERYRDPTRYNRERSYEAVIKRADELGINLVDAQHLLQEQVTKYPFRFFAPTGSHWNDVASCLVLQGINSKLKSLGDTVFPSFSCEAWQYEDVPRVKDRDLLDLVGLVWPQQLFKPTPYVVSARQRVEGDIRPSILLVGTSYLFAIREQLFEYDLVTPDATTLAFYFKSVKNGRANKFNILRKDRIDWPEWLNRDIIIINAGVGSPASAGYGFTEAALKFLDTQ